MSKEYFKMGFWAMAGMMVAATFFSAVDKIVGDVMKDQKQNEKPEEKSKADEWADTIK